ncbi:hypothetical protein ACVW1C_002578 [Bradyrhizobium sp. USDA 4011]
MRSWVASLSRDDYQSSKGDVRPVFSTVKTPAAGDTDLAAENQDTGHLGGSFSHLRL